MALNHVTQCIILLIYSQSIILLIYCTLSHFYHTFIAHQLQKLCHSVVPISCDLSDQIKPQLNVRFYSAAGLIEKIYLDVFPGVS